MGKDEIPRVMRGPGCSGSYNSPRCHCLTKSRGKMGWVGKCYVTFGRGVESYELLKTFEELSWGCGQLPTFG